MGNFKPSPYQQDIFREIKVGKGNLAISAVAGSGKSTTILEALKLIPIHKKCIFLAFNKSIVEELKYRVPSRVHVSTLHSFGMKQCFKHYGNVFMNDAKLFKFIKPVLAKEEEALKALYEEAVRANQKADPDNEFCPIRMYKSFTKKRGSYQYMMVQLINLFRANLYVNLDDLKQVNDHYAIGATDSVIQFTGDAIGRMRKYNRSNGDKKYNIDFTDMIYLPATVDMDIDKYDYVFVDECQDLNRAQQELMFKMLKRGSRFIAVGDPYQAIYGFAGSDVESFNRLVNQPNTKSLPLSVCYRCGKNIIEHARKVYDHIEPFEGAADGVVREDGHIDEIRSGDFVLCRNTAPLISLYFALLAEGQKSFIKGRDIGENLLREIEPYKHMPAEKTELELDEGLDNLAQKLKEKGLSNPKKSDKYIAQLEKVAVLKALLRQFTMTREAHVFISKIFREEGEGVTLSTIHKSKGLEADRVFVVRRDLMPSEFAVKKWQLEQEKNLEYVMITRAKKELIYIPTLHWTDKED